MISSSVVFLFALAVVLTLLLPAVALPLLALRKKIDWLPLGLGFLSFLVSQVLTRIPLLQALGTQEWYRRFASEHRVVLLLLLALTAGLFEESARLGGAAPLGPRKPAYPGSPPRPGYRTWRGALSFGLGHGCCELILLVGMSHVNNLLFSVLTNTGGAEILGGLLPAGQIEQAAAQLAAVQPLEIAAGLLERVSALLFHLFATALVFLAFARRKWILFPLAVLAHTLFNGLAVLPLGLWPMELLLLLAAMLCAAVFWRSRNWFPSPAQPE